MILYQKFRNSSLDTSPIGLMTGAGISKYVFTPSGARVIAWSTESKGMHFCQVSGLDDVVFAVDPSAPPGDCIHPVAKNILDFIGLICACGHVSVIANAYQWSRFYFHTQVSSLKPNAKSRSVLRALQNIYHPTAIESPYDYIISVQKSFDYSKLPLHADYFEWCPVRPGTPDWRVSGDTDFAGSCEKRAALKELSVKRQFQWKNDSWCVPACYLDEQCIVVDSYLEAAPEALLAYAQKWGMKCHQTLSVEEEIQRDLENPLSLPAQGVLTVNKKTVTGQRTFTAIWNPLTENPWNVRRTLDHYGLDRDKGYLLRRDVFLRKGHSGAIRTVELTLSADTASVPGERFYAPAAGKSITFKHPETNIDHTLTVVSQLREALDPNFLSNHPCCYTRLHYTLTPPIHRSLFQIVDCDPGDAQQEPIKIPAADRTPVPGHCAISSLRFAHPNQIQWQMLFKRKLRPDVHVRLLP